MGVRPGRHGHHGGCRPARCEICRAAADGLAREDQATRPHAVQQGGDRRSRGVDLGWLPLLDAATQEALLLEREVACVSALAPAAKRLAPPNGRVLDHNDTLPATGAAPVPLDVPSADISHVCLLRALGDVKATPARVRIGGRAVVIGTDLIGMEAAFALVMQGMTVTAADQDAALMLDGRFGDRVSAATRTLHGSKGIGFRLGIVVTRITPAPSCRRPVRAWPPTWAASARGWIMPVGWCARRKAACGKTPPADGGRVALGRRRHPRAARLARHRALAVGASARTNCRVRDAGAAGGI